MMTSGSTCNFEEKLQKTFNVNEMTIFQVDALTSLLERRDVFISGKKAMLQGVCYCFFV